MKQALLPYYLDEVYDQFHHLATEKYFLPFRWRKMERTQKKAANLGQNVQNGWDTRQSVQLFHKETVVRNAVLIYNY